jgi:hypothetical protein
LIKEPVKTVSKYPYDWHKPGFFTSWTPQGKTVILCFNAPTILKEAIIRSAMATDLELEMHMPFKLHNILVEEIVTLFDKSVWAWRDLVRDLEKVSLDSGILYSQNMFNNEQNRPINEPPNPGYISMHEIARHILHSSETLAVASETVSSIMAYQASLPKPSNQEASLALRNIQTEVQYQASLLKCLQLRSQAVEARLKNEINLVGISLSSRLFVYMLKQATNHRHST